MITKKHIQAIVESCIDRDNQFIVDVSVKPGNKINVIVDDYKGIAIDKCAEISRTIESSLNRDDEDYDLEVTSPGLTNPFRVLQQYQKNIGNDVEVLFKTGIKTKAKLKSVDEKGINVEVEINLKQKADKKKQKTIENHFISFENIKSTKLLLSFK